MTHRAPLDLQAVKDSETLFIIPVTNSFTGETEYFSNRDCDVRGVDLLDVLGASMASPYWYGRDFYINGQPYFDGGDSDPLPVEHVDVKDKRKIIFLTREESFDLNTLGSPNSLTRALLRLQSRKPGVYKALESIRQKYIQRLNYIKELEEQGDIVLRPKFALTKLDNSQRNIEFCIEQGRKDVMGDQRIRELLDNLRKSDRRDFYFGE